MLGMSLTLLGAISLRRQPRSLSFLLMWLLLIPAVILFTLDRRNHWFSPRYIIQALPAWLLLVGAGLAELGGWVGRWVESGNMVARRVAAPIGTFAVTPIFLVLVSPSPLNTVAEPHENIREAAAYLRQNCQPGDLVVAPVIGRYLHHYLPREIPVLDMGDSVTVELTGRSYERVFVMQSRFSRLQASDAPWINPENVLEMFLPGTEIYRGPAGETATIYLLQRLRPLAPSDSTGVDYSDDLRHLAAEARGLQDWKMAAVVLEALLSRHPDVAGLWTELGLALNMRGGYEAAIDAYDRAIALNPEHIWAHLLATNSYRLMGDPSGGLVYARQAVELDSAQVEAWSALGNIQLSLGRPDIAAGSFTQGISQQADDLSAWYGYARSATALDLPNGPEAWLKVLSLKPPDSMISEACQFLTADAHTACNP